MWNRREPLWGGLECNEFYSKVCFELKRATKREIYEVKQELAGHLQDHTEVLVEQGYDPYQAELRAIAGMGDPVEIGKALNKSYSVFWLICKWVFIVLFCILLLRCCNATVFQNLHESLKVRLPSQENFALITDEDFTLELGSVQRLDLKMETEHTVIRLDQLATGKLTDRPEGEAYCVCLSVTDYSKNPFDGTYMHDRRLHLAGDYADLSLETVGYCSEIGGISNGMYYVFTVDYGVEQIEVIWERYGQDCRAQLSLDWEGVS